jgi:phosphatidate cytidylyltransferase
MAFVFTALLLSTIIYYVLKFKNPEKNLRELKLRISSWWWMVLFLFTALSLGFKASLVFFALLSYLALKEFLSIVPTRLSDRRVVFWAYLAIPLHYYFIHECWYGMFIIFIPVYVFLFLPMRMLLIGDTKGFIKSSGIIHWGVMLTVFCISHLAFLLTLEVKNIEAGVMGNVLFVLIMTQFNDVAQYIWGKLLGNRKIIPKISPNKTWAGFLGGVFTITIMSYFVAPLLTPLSQIHGLYVGALIAVSNVILKLKTVAI